MSETLEVQFDVKPHRVTYSVEKGLITVRTAFSSKATQIGGSLPETLARIMAKELLMESKGQGLL